MADYKLKYPGEEIDAILDKAKEADPLEDLADIREGASKGMTAIQPYEENGHEYAAVDGLIDKNGAYWYLPEVNDSDPNHTFAMMGDINAVREDLANDKKDLKDYTDQAIATAIEDAITRQLNTLI